MTAELAVVGFCACAAVIFAAGGRLGRYGERIADATGLGGTWIGLILLATVTSLPELIVGISSSTVVGSADLAVGDVLGSCAFNLFLLAALDAFVPHRRPLFAIASGRNVLAGALQIILLAVAGLGLLYPVSSPALPWIGWSSLALLVGYLLAIRLVYRQAQRAREGQEPLPDLDVDGAGLADLTLRQVALRYAAVSLVIVSAAAVLPLFAQAIARGLGLEESLVGTLFLAATTSLPELAVSLAVIRRGAVDLAVGNLLGSNLFNMTILAIDDLVYLGGPLLGDASGIHLVTVVSTIAMTAIAIIGLTYRPTGKRLVLAWDAAAILAVYAVNLGLVATS
nr:sodium:calcium antiporter [Propionibacterium sp.]